MMRTMNSKQIQENLHQYIIENNFNAPYGVILGEGKSSKGKKYVSVTFGRARTLDAEVQIYNSNFMILKTSRNNYNSQVYKSYDSLIEKISQL